jgi:hypothetical protein
VGQTGQADDDLGTLLLKPPSAKEAMTMIFLKYITDTN